MALCLFAAACWAFVSSFVTEESSAHHYWVGAQQPLQVSTVGSTKPESDCSLMLAQLFMCIAVQASAAQQRWACDGNAHVCLYAVVWFVCTQLQLDSAEHMKAQDTNSITLWLEVQFFTSSHFIWWHFSLHYCLIMCLCKNTAAGATKWPKFKASNHLRKSSNQWSEACVPSCNDRPGRVTALHT